MNQINKFVERIFAIAIFISFTLMGAQAQAQQIPKARYIEPPKNVLFIGNSFTYYNNSLHGRLRDLVKASDNVNTTSNTFRAITISGAYLSQHEAGLKGIVDEKSWDVVILQGQSTEPIDPEKSENFQNTTRKYAKIIRNSGAEPLLFMTWAYKDKPEMTQRLSDAYTILANEIGGMVIPVGLAFERALKVKPNLRLHIEDNKHPTLKGTYLSACVFYAALYDDSPIGNEYDAGLDSKMVAFLQEIAWATVNDFYKR